MKSEMSKMCAAIALTAGIGSVLASGDASAVTRARNFVQNATGACQSALPTFDGQIRKRPLALQNEGTDSAFVSCSFVGTTEGIGGSRSIASISLYADNSTLSDVNMTCTLVDGYSGGGNVYFPKTITLPANSRLNEFSWTPSDNGGSKYQVTINVSCNLPVGSGLSLSVARYEEDVGA